MRHHFRLSCVFFLVFKHLQLSLVSFVTSFVDDTAPLPSKRFLPTGVSQATRVWEGYGTGLDGNGKGKITATNCTVVTDGRSFAPSITASCHGVTHVRIVQSGRRHRGGGPRLEPALGSGRNVAMIDRWRLRPVFPQCSCMPAYSEALGCDFPL